jgi:hypothetical protein
MVEGDEQVDELDMAGYNDEKRQFVNVLNSGDDDEEMKMGFLMKNTGWISLKVFLGVLWV